MTRTKPLALIALGMLATVAAGPLAAAAPSAKATIAARHANFEKMGKAMKTLKSELGGSADKAKMLPAAKTIAAMARRQTSLFPAGTGPASGLKTEALAKIWTDRAAFDAEMQKLIAESDKLVVAVAKGDAAAQFKAVGATCGSCHRQFREED